MREVNCKDPVKSYIEYTNARNKMALLLVHLCEEGVLDCDREMERLKCHVQNITVPTSYYGELDE